MNDQVALVKNIVGSFANSAAEILPKIVTALVLLLIGWIVAKIASGIVKKVLETLNVERFMDQIREIDIFSGVTTKLSHMLSKMVYWGIMLIVFIMASEVLGMQTITDGISSLLAYIPKLFSAVIFFVLGSLLANIIKNFIESAMNSMNLKIGKFLSSLVFYFLLIMIAISALNQAGIGTDIIQDNFKIIVGAFVFSLGLGYAISSKDLVSNLLAGYYSKSKLKKGQVITFKGTTGKVLSTDNTSVTLESEGKRTIIPLSQFLSEKIEIMD